MNRDYLIHIAKRYPVEAIVVRHLHDDGLDTEEKLRSYLETQTISVTVINKLMNTFRDIYRNNFYNPEIIPQLNLGTNENKK